MDDMTDNEDHEQPIARLALRVSAEADPSALTRILAFFQNGNLIPMRIEAEFATNRILHIRVDTSDVSEEQMALIAAKVGEVPCVLNAYWHCR
jgi:hypothetical protein